MIGNEYDRREVKMRERKMQIELERRKRIFNVRQRVIGVDVPALEKQIEDNELKRKEKDHIERAYDTHQQREGALVYQLSLKEQADRRRINEEIRDYRKNYQKREYTREFDLNDPDGWKQDIPPCQREDIGISSAQKFADEEKTDERKKIMKDQRLAWLQQQKIERKILEEEQKAADDAFKQLAVDRAKRGTELENLEKMCRRRVAETTIRFNQAMAEERRMQRAIDRENELQDNKAEIYNNLTSGLLCEVHDMCTSALGPKKIVSGAYKGMTPEERARIRKDQIEQIALNKIRRDQEKIEDQKWMDLSNSILRSIYNKDVEYQKKKRETATDVLKDNTTIATEQNLRKQQTRKMFGENQPTEEYHKQFNTTTR